MLACMDQVQTFSSLQDAHAAVEALAAAGLPRDQLQLIVREEEAGPVAGNFLIGNGETTHGGRPGAVRTGSEVPYEENFRDTSYRGAYLLVLARMDDHQMARAQAVLSRFDTVAVEEVAASGQAR
jgi:hypothetical protein